MLAELYPRGRTAGYHRQSAAVFQSVEEFRALFHYGEVRSEIDVEDVREAYAAECRDHFAFHVGADGITEFFAESDAYGGRHSDHNVFGGVGKRGENVVYFFTLGERSDGAHGYALSAAHAGNLGKRLFESAADVGVETSRIRAYDSDGLILFARRNAPAAKHALVVVAYDIGRGRVHDILVFDALILVPVTAEFQRKALQFAVVVARTAQAVLVVVGKDEFDGGLSAFHNLGSVGEHFHTFAHGIDAGRDQTPRPFHFAHAYAAGADGVDVFEIAKSGDFHARFLCCLQYGGALFDADGNIVYFQVDFCHSSLLYSLTIAPKRQVSIHTPHLMHLDGSMVNLDLISPEIAPTGHLRAHAEQPLQSSVMV